MSASAGHRCIGMQEKRGGGDMDMNSRCPSLLLKPPTNTLFAHFGKGLASQDRQKPDPEIWQSESWSKRPSLGWCLSTFWDAKLEGSRSDFSKLMTIPTSWQRWRSWSRCYCKRGTNSTVINQLSRYHTSRIHLLWVQSLIQCEHGGL